MKAFRILLCSLVLASCSTTRAVYDYDQQVDFQSYSTYGIYPEFGAGLSQLDERRLLNSLERSLAEKGLSTASEPDIYVNAYSEQYQEQSRNTLGIGVGGTGGNIGVGVSGGIPIGGPETFIRLTFDFIDVQDDSLVWQAVVESKFDPNARPERRQVQFDRIVEKALRGYPPKK